MMSAAKLDSRGITRRRAGNRWRYFGPRGNELTKPARIGRLNQIGLPPAYRDAWFSPDPDSPIQANSSRAQIERDWRGPRSIASR